MKKKLIIIVVSMTLALICAVGGTLAWLADSTGTVVNTFTVGDVNIDLWEHTLSADGKTLNTGDDDITRKGNSGYKLIPGNVLEKDPTVTVKGGSEACWLFIEVVLESADYLDFEIDSAWTPLDGCPGIYYIELDSATEKDTDYGIIDGNAVRVDVSLTKDHLESITSDPQISITAYAIQRDNVPTAADAWNNLGDA